MTMALLDNSPEYLLKGNVFNDIYEFWSYKGFECAISMNGSTFKILEDSDPTNPLFIETRNCFFLGYALGISMMYDDVKHHLLLKNSMANAISM